MNRLAKQSEATRYGPLTSAMNSILRRYHGVEVGGMVHRPSDDDLIYVVQDPSNIFSSPLTPEGPALKTLRKPDSVGITLKRLCQLLGQESFADWVAKLAAMNDDDWKDIERKERTEWVDTWNVWELKYKKSTKRVVFPVFKANDFWQEGML